MAANGGTRALRFAVAPRAPFTQIRIWRRGRTLPSASPRRHSSLLLSFLSPAVGRGRNETHAPPAVTLRLSLSVTTAEGGVPSFARTHAHVARAPFFLFLCVPFVSLAFGSAIYTYRRVVIEVRGASPPPPSLASFLSLLGRLFCCYARSLSIPLSLCALFLPSLLSFLPCGCLVCARSAGGDSLSRPLLCGIGEDGGSALAFALGGGGGGGVVLFASSPPFAPFASPLFNPSLALSSAVRSSPPRPNFAI